MRTAFMSTPVDADKKLAYRGNSSGERGNFVRGTGSGKISRPMNREYHKAYSHELNRDMELLVFGHAGQPILVFPSSMGAILSTKTPG